MPKLHSNVQIGFSAQFGGRDAADLVLPHFSALKAAAVDVNLPEFPYPELAYILRVDGEVSQYGFSGTGEPEFDQKRAYLGIELGVTLEDRGDVSAAICAGILHSPEIMNLAIRSQDIYGFDANSLNPSLKLLCKAYVEIVRSEPQVGFITEQTR